MYFDLPSFWIFEWCDLTSNLLAPSDTIDANVFCSLKDSSANFVGKKNCQTILIDYCAPQFDEF